MDHTEIEFFRELGKLEGGQNTKLNAHILDIAAAKAGEHQRVGKALEGIREHLGKSCDDPDLEAATTFANQIAKEAMFPDKIRAGFKIRVAAYLKSLSGKGSGGGKPGEAPGSEREAWQRKEDDPR